MPTQLCHGALTASALGRLISRLAKRLVQPVTDFNVISINQSEVSSSPHAKTELQKVVGQHKKAIVNTALRLQ